MATSADYTGVFIRVNRGEVILYLSHMDVPFTLHVGGALDPDTPPLRCGGAKGAFPGHVPGEGGHPGGVLGVVLGVLVSVVKGVGKVTITG